jgi:predicted metalloprotease with PDZ domain
LLFRFGLITSSELLDEMHGLAGIVSTSTRRKESNAALGAHAKEAGVVPLLVARGALYSARIEGLLRKKSLGKKGLPELLRALYATAKTTRGALQPSQWTDALGSELDAGEKKIFHDVILDGALPDLPEGLLGPCFQGSPHTYAAFDLGFDEPATRATPSLTIVGLRLGGPAERAGLRATDVLIDAAVSQGRADARVTLTVERGDQKKIISYLPAGPTAAWRGWVRKRDVAEEACTK